MRIGKQRWLPLVLFATSALALAGLLVAGARYDLSTGRLWPTAGFLLVAAAGAACSLAVWPALERRALRLLGTTVPDGVRLGKPLWSILGDGLPEAVSFSAAAGAVAAVVGFPEAGVVPLLAVVVIGCVVSFDPSDQPRAVTFEPAGLRVHVRKGAFLVRWTNIISVETSGSRGNHGVDIPIRDLDTVLASATPNVSQVRSQARILLQFKRPRGPGLRLDPWMGGLDGSTLASALRERLGDLPEHRRADPLLDPVDTSVDPPPDAPVRASDGHLDPEPKASRDLPIRWSLVWFGSSVLALAGVLLLMRAGTFQERLPPVARFLAAATAVACYSACTTIVMRRRRSVRQPRVIPRGVHLRLPAWIALNLFLIPAGAAAMAGAVVAGLGFPGAALGISLALCVVGEGLVVVGWKLWATVTFADEGLWLHMARARSLVPWSSIGEVAIFGKVGFRVLAIQVTDPAGILASTTPETPEARGEMSSCLLRADALRAELILVPFVVGLDAATMANAVGVAARDARTSRGPN